MPRSRTRRPDHHHHATSQISNRLKALFLVIEPIVQDVDMVTGKDLFGVAEVHAASPEGLLSLPGIESDLRQIHVPPINPMSMAMPLASLHNLQHVMVV
jgi:hypothetical protein